MLKSSVRPVIRLRGVRHNNLKNFDLDLPLHQLIVVTGLSGSGKSSLAFDTLFAEGQRRYIETFSPYARQFFDRMDKPQVDLIEGIPPAIAIEQRNAVKTTRSTVGTMTEICDYLKLVWPQLAQLHCRQCGRLVRKEPPQQIWAELSTGGGGAGEARPDLLVTFDLALTEKLSLEESLGLVSRQGYQRLLLDGQVVRLEAALPQLQARRSRPAALTIVQDRLAPTPAHRARFVEACEQAYHFGKGRLMVWEVGARVVNPRFYSNRFHCAQCDLEYRPPSPALFSFNHPVGACPTCRGFGRVINIDYRLALPDRSKTLAQGVVKPWQTGLGAECQADLLRMCRHFEIPTDVPFDKLPKKWQDFVIDGEPGYGSDEEHQWPRAWYGIKGYFRWLESKAYKMHVRVLLSRYRAYSPCPVCQGQRFQPEALLYRIPAENHAAGLTLAGFYQLPIRDALRFVERLAAQRPASAKDPLALVLHEVRSRLSYLNEVGLGYLTLDRPTRSLSGGETERVSLTTCLGTRLVNTLFVLDEPSVGLHPRDTQRLVRLLQQLRDAGNTVLVVEHEPSVMRAADQILDLGPGHGATGGQVVFQGTYQGILDAPQSLTGSYLSGRRRIEVPPRRPVSGVTVPARANGPLALREAPAPFRAEAPAVAGLRLAHVTRHNLHDLTVEIPLGRFVCITGVSGSGKTTLMREVLLPGLRERLHAEASDTKASDRLGAEDHGGAQANGDHEDEDDSPVPGSVDLELTGAEHLGQVVLVDQSILSKTPRSNPAVYIGAFDDIREVFAQSELARQRGLNASAFSFNSAQGQCERCRGAGFEKIEMQFLSDVFIRCPDCGGHRYRSHILEVKLAPGTLAPGGKSEGKKAKAGRNLGQAQGRSFSIADLLEATVDEAAEFLGTFEGSKSARRALDSLRLLQEVGLGYLQLGQPINTLSGGESQRLKLVKHLADAVVGDALPQGDGGRKPILFLFDEPTTGLHFDDVRVLLRVFQRLVDAGHSVLVIEHNLEVIKSADWLLDLGPDAGDQGGQLVAQGTPEAVAACPASHTGQALKEVLAFAEPRQPVRPPPSPGYSPTRKSRAPAGRQP